MKVAYYFAVPYVMRGTAPLDGADIRDWTILASTLNLCGEFVHGNIPVQSVQMVNLLSFSHGHDRYRHFHLLC